MIHLKERYESITEMTCYFVLHRYMIRLFINIPALFTLVNKNYVIDVAFLRQETKKSSLSFPLNAKYYQATSRN